MVPGFLKAGGYLIDGERMGTEKRVALAKSLGFQSKKGDLSPSEQVLVFLKEQGYSVQQEATKYGEIYYNYRSRLNNHPDHKEKTDLHKQRMAIRYTAKQFLCDYYEHARRLEGLTVYDTYAEAKLGLTHGRDPSAEQAM